MIRTRNTGRYGGKSKPRCLIRLLLADNGQGTFSFLFFLFLLFLFLYISPYVYTFTNFPQLLPFRRKAISLLLHLKDLFLTLYLFIPTSHTLSFHSHLSLNFQIFGFRRRPSFVNLRGPLYEQFTNFSKPLPFGPPIHFHFFPSGLLFAAGKSWRSIAGIGNRPKLEIRSLVLIRKILILRLKKKNYINFNLSL
jgi:hypothetical protein